MWTPLVLYLFNYLNGFHRLNPKLVSVTPRLRVREVPSVLIHGDLVSSSFQVDVTHIPHLGEVETRTSSRGSRRLYRESVPVWEGLLRTSLHYLVTLQHFQTGEIGLGPCDTTRIRWVVRYDSPNSEATQLRNGLDVTVIGGHRLKTNTGEVKCPLLGINLMYR